MSKNTEEIANRLLRGSLIWVCTVHANLSKKFSKIMESGNYFPQKLGRSLAEFINSFRSAAQIVTISGKFFTLESLVDIS